MQAHTPLPLGPAIPRARAGRVRALVPLAGLPAGALLVAGLLLALGSGAGERAKGTAQSAAKQRALHAYGRLPLRFEANQGQTDRSVSFLARGAGYTLFLTPRESVLSLVAPAHRAAHGQGAAKQAPAGGKAPTRAERHAVVRMRLAGASAHPDVNGLKRLPGVTNYVKGERKDWQTGVPGYGAALQRGVYPGIDLLYHGKQGRLEYDFRVAPGADPRRIGLDFSGQQKLSLDRRGNLVLHTRAGTVRQHRPVVYQRIAGERRPVTARFRVHRHHVGFAVGRYDHTKPLVIDPELVYSTFLGGSGGSDVDFAKGIAVDGSGSAYTVGYTTSLAFPTKNAYQAGKANPINNFCCSDAYVTKFDPTGRALVYSTYLGGEADDAANAVAVDPAGRAYVTGSTQSSGFPVTAGAYQATENGPDAFLSVLDTTASGAGSLLYSTYLGGSGYDLGSAIAIDPSHKAYVTGLTQSPGFAAKGAGGAAPFQTSYGGSGDAFVAKLDTAAADAASSLVYWTYLGGSDGDYGNGIAVDGAGDAYVTGTTSSNNFPTSATPAQDALDGSADAFVTKLNPDGGALLYSSYLGGGGYEDGAAIALESTDHAYVTGSTQSTDFPTKNAFQPSHGGDPATDNTNDAFVAKLDTSLPGLGSLVYSSYLGGPGGDSGSGIAVDSAGAAHVTGTADDRGAPGGFPTVDPVAPPGVGAEAFITKVRPDGTGLAYSSYLAGGGDERAKAIAVDGLTGSAYVAGDSSSSDFPTRDPFQPQNQSGGSSDYPDAFVLKVAPVGPAAPLVTGLGHRSGPAGTSVTIIGHGFSGASAVRFGGSAAAPFTVDSDTKITATAPAHADGAVPVTVVTAQGSSPANPIARFVYALGIWDRTGDPVTARTDFEPPSATPLRDGRALVAGGCCDPSTYGPIAAAELYDPASGKWSATDPMVHAHDHNTATLLRSGKVLVTGGYDENYNTTDSTELYDPATGKWSSSAACGAPSASCPAPMRVARLYHKATLLANGKVLVTGGVDASFDALGSAELYDPENGKWTLAPPMHDPRFDHTATLLDAPACHGGSPPAWCGKALVAGGTDYAGAYSTRSAELFDPKDKTWTRTGSLGFERTLHTATALRNGRVLVAGGEDDNGSPRSSAEIYDPATGKFGFTHGMSTRRSTPAAAPLPDGKVLVTGGRQVYAELNSAEVYDPASGNWRPGGVMTHYRGFPFALRLASGRVLVGAGDRSSGASTTELYTPTGAAGAGPGPDTGAGTKPAADRTAPIVTGFRLVPKRFRVGRRSTPRVAVSRRARVGSSFRYRLSEEAKVRILIERRTFGRRSGGKCRRATRALRGHRRCVRYVRAGAFRRMGRAGSNRHRFSGRIGRRKLRPGRYRASIRATDAAGNRSRLKRARFRIVRR